MHGEREVHMSRTKQSDLSEDAVEEAAAPQRSASNIPHLVSDYSGGLCKFFVSS